MPDFFFISPSTNTEIITGEYQTGLVVLSIVIAITICCVAMQIVGISQVSETPTLRRLAIATGSLSLGIGIWSMHFIGMIAFHINTEIHYDFTITALSIIPAVIAAWFALSILARKNVTPKQLFISALWVGIGIGTMHYSGMAAMKLEPLLRYNYFWFLVSLIVAVSFSWFALFLRTGLKDNIHLSNIGKTLLSGTVMGISIASMHYVAMRAACFIGTETPNFQPQSDTSLIFSIASTTLVIGGIVLTGNLFLLFRNLYRQLHRSEAIQKGIIDTSMDGVITFDENGLVISINPSITRLFLWKEHELIGKNINILMPEQHRSQGSMKLVDYLRSRSKRIIGKDRETSALRKDGSVFPIRLSLGEIFVNNQTMFVGFIADITEQKRIEKMLEREATHDSLTDLPNRRLLSIAMPRILARADRTGELIAILFIDLDGFKAINDRMGHDTGDDLLKIIATRLLKMVRTTDLVARLGGDEFVILLEGLSSKDDAGRMAKRVLIELSKSMILNKQSVSISGSIGMSFYEKGCKLTSEELLQMADQAMYQAKNSGKNNISIIESV